MEEKLSQIALKNYLKSLSKNRQIYIRWIVPTLIYNRKALNNFFDKTKTVKNSINHASYQLRTFVESYRNKNE